MTDEKPKKKTGVMGRPRNIEPTKQVRVPVALIPVIEDMVKAYKMRPTQQATQ